ncbi:MAG: hypothetical protein J5833_07205 [Victivallales bacterium]|nr:hypothetical protein [Victivallales bacterium]
MNSLTKIYKILIAAFAVAVVLQLFFVWKVVLPKREEVDALSNDVALIINKLRGSKWPMDAGKLDQHIDELQLEIDGAGPSALITKSRDAMEKCQKTFKGKLKAEYGTVQDFMRNASRMDYQAEFNRIVDDYRKKGILLSPSVLNLSEEMSTQYIYQPLMQLWTVEKLIDLATAAGVDVAKSGTGREQAAMVSAKPMKAFFKSASAERPYLLEFPVEITVVGGFQECLAFIDSLNGNDVFLPPGSFEIFALPPEGKANAAGKLRMRLVCSSFLAGERGL